MRIAIDATAVPAQRVGAGNYIIQLVRSLAELDHGQQLFVFAKPEEASVFQALPKTRFVSVSQWSRIQRILWEQVLFPIQIKARAIDVLHSPHYTMPIAARCALVVTFHDMTFFLYPHMHQAYKRIFFRAMIRVSARRANAIIADSESSRQDILRILQSDPNQVFTVPLGVTDRFRPTDDTRVVEAIRRKYHLPDQTILYVGVLEPRKNLPTLVRAFKLLVDRGVSHSLVIVGRKGWMYGDLFQTIKSLDLSDRVIFTGYVPEEELPLLYNAAALFVYPSLYEGFGLPVLEAMACGIPVITSNVSSMPEIVGDAGILVDPRRAEELADAMTNTLRDPDLRHHLALKGRERSKLFSWERTARETLAVYQRVTNAQ